MSRPTRANARTKRLVVLVSGTGTLLQALIDATSEPSFGAEIVAVGSDRPGVQGLARAERVGIPTFVHPLSKGADRAEWDRGLTARVGAWQPDLVVAAGFLKLVGADFLAAFGGRTINTHPALLPSFPGIHGPRDAMTYGVKVSGATVFLVDGGVDTGVILAQQAVSVAVDDTVETLHEKIKIVERAMLLEVTHDLVTRDWQVVDRKVRWRT